MPVAEKKWEWRIGTKTSFLGPDSKELWSYRHLLAGLVRRDFILNYQQTVLGPVWMLFQPILTLVTYILVFNKMVGISTGTVPPVLFYFSGIVLWNFFSGCLTGTAATFRDNADLFSKVYFPRIVIPFAVISTQLLRFSMQLLMLLLVILYYWLFQGLSLNLDAKILAIPISILYIGLIGLGVGLILSVITAKYRDLSSLVSLGIRLFMFVTPVIYPMATVPENVRWVAQLNPLTPPFEAFRLSLLGEGTVTGLQLVYSGVFMVVVLLGALFLFNKQGDKLIDVV